MTAKESLETLVSRLTEAEAEALLARISSTLPRDERPDHRAAALALLAQWRNDPPVMTEEDWDRFAQQFDSERPNAPSLGDPGRDAG